jgi:glycosyltransferase involved in cell wall biosynthesis
MSETLEITLIEPFLTGSHEVWAKGLCSHSRHNIKVLSLPGRNWRWRMRGGAITLAQAFLAENHQPDLLLATDMLDFPTFLGLTRQQTQTLPSAIYFHENQLVYPSQAHHESKPGHTSQYGLLNFTSALAADGVFFNSDFNRLSFLDALPNFLKGYPDYQGLDRISEIAEKSSTLHYALNLSAMDRQRPTTRKPLTRPLILWNHRWEYDKNPTSFFRALGILADEGLDFSVAVLGENLRDDPKEFNAAQAKLGERILQFGYTETAEEYARWLWEADLLPVTSRHDFFGASVAEAVYCNTKPLLPRRLAYPELFPDDSESLFYDGFDDLVERLRAEIKAFPQAAETKQQETPWRKQVRRFDWREQIEIYDTAFERLVGR